MAEIRNVRKDIGQRIQEARKAKGLNQDELAKRLGSKRTTIGNYERGERSIDTDMIKKIASVLNVPSMVLIDGIPDDLKNYYSIKELVKNGKNSWDEYFSDVQANGQINFLENVYNKSKEITETVFDLRDMNDIEYLDYLQIIVSKVRKEVTLNSQSEKLDELIRNTSVSKKQLKEIKQYDPFESLRQRREEEKGLTYHVYVGDNSASKLYKLIKNYNSHIPTKSELQGILDKLEQEERKHRD